jgi:hypothetical protein
VSLSQSQKHIEEKVWQRSSTGPELLAKHVTRAKYRGQLKLKDRIGSTNSGGHPT